MALIAGGATAMADNAVIDGDAAALGLQGSLTLGTIPCNVPTTRQVNVLVERLGGGNVFAGGSALSVTGQSANPQIAPGTSLGLRLPTGWASLPLHTLSDPAALPITVTPTWSVDPLSTQVAVNVTGPKTGGGTLTRPVSFDVTWSSDCTPPAPANAAPSAPGTPSATQSPTQGGFSLSWAASADAQNNPFTYTLEGKDANDAGWSTIASGLTTPSYAFTSGNPTEGTWTYRVKAVETSTSPALSSGYSGESAGVVVDQSAPNVTADAGTPAYAPADATPWWKDTATVTFTANDPALADGSAGSGVKALTDPIQYSTEGEHTGAGTATDNAGNTSGAASATAHVDTAKPVVTATCPAQVVEGSSFEVGWTATDSGSGVAGNTSGTLTQTAPTAIGSSTATVDAGIATDNVGHSSDAATCDYKVIYNFAGFFQPVTMGVTNSVKAGSAVPLKFSLGGDYGLGVISAAKLSPLVSADPTGQDVTATVFAIGSGLAYDAVAGQYVYVWKTDKSWSGRKGTLTITLNDGTDHMVDFYFK